MRTQQDREEQTVVIATALGIFVVILLALELVAWWLQSVTHGLDGYGDVIVWPAVLLAGIVGCSHVARSRRR